MALVLVELSLRCLESRPDCFDLINCLAVDGGDQWFLPQFQQSGVALLVKLYGLGEALIDLTLQPVIFSN